MDQFQNAHHGSRMLSIEIFHEMKELFYSSHSSTIVHLIKIAGPALIPNPSEFSFVGEPSGFDSIQSWPNACDPMPRRYKGYKQ